jgi:O-antigen/teichoic acid export membrane protein
MSLSQKALGGFFWTLTSNVGRKVIGLVIGLILARLLTTKDFGLVAMLYIFFEVSQSLVKSGFGQSLIREDEITELDKSSIYYFNFFISIICFVLLWFAAPYIADFYDNNKIVDLVHFMAFTVIIQAFSIVQNASLNHALDFKNLSKILIATEILTGIMAIIFA